MNKDKNKPIEVLEAEVAKVDNSKQNSSDALDIVNIDELSDSTQLAIIKDLLPTTTTGKALTAAEAKSKDPLYQYIKEISKYKLLSRDEEMALVEKMQETGDIEVAKKLVMANLRLVVKISMEYKNAYKNVMDLIQEGNMGLMKAVSKYNPDKGAKLSYYASWWIKSYILKFILDNFRLIKIGTTADQKKLFYNFCLLYTSPSPRD